MKTIISILAYAIMMLSAPGSDSFGADGRLSGSRDSQRVVCLAFDALEMVDAIGCAGLVVGRPEGSDPARFPNAREVGSFVAPDPDAVLELHPDLVITSSDIQAAAAESLVRRHCTLLALNIYTIKDIYNSLRLLGRILGKPGQGEAVAAEMQRRVEAIRSESLSAPARVKVHFEEYDDPVIAGGEWISEMIAIAGGIDVNAEMSTLRSASQRVVSAEMIAKRDPDVIIAAWCGKPFHKQSIMEREGWGKIKAIRENRVYAVPPDLVLQPSPRIVEGIEAIRGILKPLTE